jgi:hypothetical protein
LRLRRPLPQSPRCDPLLEVIAQLLRP